MVFKRKKKQATPKRREQEGVIIKKKHREIIKKKEDYKFVNTEDIPDAIENGKIYIVGEDGYDWVAVLKCPCGCKETIQLNLLTDARPCWKIIHHKDKTMSLSPSINRTVNCKSHFSISRNMLSWWGGHKDDYEY